MSLKYLEAEPQPEEGCRCPCCGFKTLEQHGFYEICPACFWEDDGQGDADADMVPSELNAELSLSEARSNFERFGACEQQFALIVRRPLPHEM